MVSTTYLLSHVGVASPVHVVLAPAAVAVVESFNALSVLLWATVLKFTLIVKRSPQSVCVHCDNLWFYFHFNVFKHLLLRYGSILGFWCGFGDAHKIIRFYVLWQKLGLKCLRFF